MDMHAAALPPRSGHHTAADRAHPLFAEWQRYEASCRRNLIDGTDFRCWLAQRERQQSDEEWMAHPRFREFQRWMGETKAGGRPCPTKPSGAFPYNFQFWLEGGRW